MNLLSEVIASDVISKKLEDFNGGKSYCREHCENDEFVVWCENQVFLSIEHHQQK